MDPIKTMKLKVINDFIHLMDKIELGKIPNYTNIMDQISFIEFYDEVKNFEFVYQYLINK